VEQAGAAARRLGLPGHCTDADAGLAPACRLRGKLAAARGQHMVVNVWGVGYRLLSPVDAPEYNGTPA
jgi:hypothetical protein